MERSQRHNEGEYAVERRISVSGYTQETETRLLELLEKELELYGQIHSLTLKQAKLLASDELDTFYKSLDDRQGLIEKINGLHQETRPLMQSYLSFSDAPGGIKSEAIDTAEAKRIAVISECKAQNDKNIATVNEKNEDHSKRIGELNKSRKTLGAYTLSVPNDSDLFDKKT